MTNKLWEAKILEVIIKQEEINRTQKPLQVEQVLVLIFSSYKLVMTSLKLKLII